MIKRLKTMHVPLNYLIKFGLSEKHTKFEKIFFVVLTNQRIYLVNVKTMRKIFSNYVCFSKIPNFTDYAVEAAQRPVCQ